jgi:hypothetical protein
MHTYVTMQYFDPMSFECSLWKPSLDAVSAYLRTQYGDLAMLRAEICNMDPKDTFRQFNGTEWTSKPAFVGL